MASSIQAADSNPPPIAPIPSHKRHVGMIAGTLQMQGAHLAQRQMKRAAARPLFEHCVMDRSYAIAFARLSDTLSRKPVVDSQRWSAPTRSARSLVM